VSPGISEGGSAADRETEHYRRLASETGHPFSEAAELLPVLDVGLSRELTRDWQEKQRVIPVSIGDGVLVVASDSPGQGERKLRRHYGVDTIEYRVVTPTGFRRLRWAVDLGEIAPLVPEGAGAGDDDLLSHDLRTEAQSVGILESLLVDAAGTRASDIHVENGPEGVRVRIRVDGDLRELSHFALDWPQAASVVRVAKVKAGIDITDARKAQGGQFETRVGGRTYFVRVQTQPTIHGENVVMRLLPQDSSLGSVGALGFSCEAEERYRRLIENPGGLVLVVGPTGSGKTTTLHAGVRLLADDAARKVISIEDPVEYVCDGVQQVETCEEVGFTFAEAMRHFVREDPDVILLGEIRDRETALEAIRASQTGHLVLTTLHCNDALDAVQRLIDLGMQPNSIASELLAVFAQRLARRICLECREPVDPDPAVASEIFPDGVPDGFRCFRGRGCDHCGETGCYGRVAVVEMLPITSALRRAICRGATLEDLRDVARVERVISLRERALELVQDGTIAFESLPRFIPLDRLTP
jgi:type IV pilus assembly protein PilB